jgi:hypothetical protein
MAAASNSTASSHGHDATFSLPVFEEPNSIQIAIIQIMRLIFSDIDAKSVTVPLHAQQTVYFDLNRADLEPCTHERVVIDFASIYETALAKAPCGLEEFVLAEEDEDAIDPDAEDSLDDEDDDDDGEVEENEDEDFDGDQEDDNSNEPEDEEEDGPPLYVENRLLNPREFSLERKATRNN